MAKKNLIKRKATKKKVSKKRVAKKKVPKKKVTKKKTSKKKATKKKVSIKKAANKNVPIKKSTKKNIIEDFINGYEKEIDYYTQLSNIAEKICRQELESNGIRCIVSSRAKSAKSLKNKIIERNKNKKYKTVKSIYKDIPDLAGVRVALYFPGDLEDIESIINKYFNVNQSKVFPEKSKTKKSKLTDYQKVFCGYVAKHFRVFIKEDNIKGGYLTPEQKRYLEANIEIQVASVLMHGWAEIEHDLIYKPKSGKMSLDEHAILDEVNGMVLAGEVALKRLQESINRRVSKEENEFQNHYELTEFMKGEFGKRSNFQEWDKNVGDSEFLFKLITRLKVNNPKGLRQYLEMITPENYGKSMVLQITEALISNDKKNSEIYLKLKNTERYRKSSTTNNMSDFISVWFPFEKVILELYKLERNVSHHHMLPTFRIIRELKYFNRNEKALYEIDRIRRIRNKLIHEGEELPNRVISDCIESIINILKDISSKGRREKLVVTKYFNFKRYEKLLEDRPILNGYYVNTNSQSNGDHEVHKKGCSYFPNTNNAKYLGNFATSKGAVTEAKKTYPKSNGCYYCMNESHES